MIIIVIIITKQQSTLIMQQIELNMNEIANQYKKERIL